LDYDTENFVHNRTDFDEWLSTQLDWVLEQEIAKKFGVARGILVVFRKEHLQKNVDWRLEKNQITLSRAAVQKISAAFGTELPPDETKQDTPMPMPAPAKPDQVPERPELIELQVVRVWPNPRLLRARTANGQLVTVAVPKNKNFRVLMRLKAWPPDPPPAPQVYRLEGRCPRYPGRW
jgi:hypothetical protein